MQLRQMTMADADKMLEWKNYPETRKFAIATHDEIKYADHIMWLQCNIQSFRVIGDQWGAVRIQDGEISIWVDRTLWGKGVASFILDDITEIGMTAKIVDGNIGSMRAFINAGFKPISYNGTYYIFQK